MAAYRRGLKRDLERVASKHSNITVEFRGGGHGLLFADAEGIADSVRKFVAANRARTMRRSGEATETETS
jgi:hypothetical protein